MFEKAFIPYVKSNPCSTERDPLDQCLIHYFDLVKQVIFIFSLYPQQESMANPEFLTRDCIFAKISPKSPPPTQKN